MSAVKEELGNQDIYFPTVYGSEARQKEVDSYVQKELGRCINCKAKATRTNNTVCIS